MPTNPTRKTTAAAKPAPRARRRSGNKATSPADQAATKPDAIQPEPTAPDKADAPIVAETAPPTAPTPAPTGEATSAPSTTNEEAASEVDTAAGAQQAPGSPARTPDRKVLMVAGVLGDFPAGATVEDIANGCGLSLTTVDRLLLAMEFAGAVVRVPEDIEAGTPELWLSGTTRATQVDPTKLPEPPKPQPCPTCGHVPPRPRRAGIRRVSTTPGFNSDGTRKFGKGELRQLVLDFVNEHRDHIFTAGTVTRELSERLSKQISSGAVGNNLASLAASGAISLHSEHPAQYTANPVPDAAKNDGTEPTPDR